MNENRTRLLLLVGLTLAVLSAHVSHYWPYISDDAFISLRYSERLLDGKGLTWADDQRVEGYSNLLWVLLVAVLGLGLDLMSAARLLGALGIGATIAAAIWAFGGRKQAQLLGAGVAGLGLALSGSIAVWTIGGLEQPLLIGLLAWAIVLLQRGAGQPWSRPAEILLPGALLAGACLTRPDAPLLVGMVGIGVLVARGVRREMARPIALLALLPVVAVLGQLAFRLIYYGDYVPNTAHVKVAWTAARIRTGVEYVLPWMLGHAPLVLLSGVALAGAREDLLLRARLLIVGPATLAWLIYMVGVGGDIFPAWRQLLPAVLGFSLMAGEGAIVLARRGERLAMGMVGGLLALMLIVQVRQEENRRALDERWEFDALAIGETLRLAFAEQAPLLAAQAAGALPYATRFPAHDILGLNDRYLATHPPKDLGEGFIGHELGDADYTLGFEPDLMSFCNIVGKKDFCFNSGRDISKDPRFKKEYVRVQVRGTDPVETTGKIWFWRESPKVGLKTEGGTVTVPGWLFGSSAEAVAALNAEGRFGLALEKGGVGTLEGVRLRPGRWKARVEGSGGVRLVVEPEERVTASEPEGKVLVFEVKRQEQQDRTSIDLKLRAKKDDAFVERVILKRERD